MARTQRPQNRCRECGATWYPRGADLSRQCPNCEGRDVEAVAGPGSALLGCLVAAVAVPILACGGCAVVGFLADRKLERIAEQVREEDRAVAVAQSPPDAADERPRETPPTVPPPGNGPLVKPKGLPAAGASADRTDADGGVAELDGVSVSVTAMVAPVPLENRYTDRASVSAEPHLLVVARLYTADVTRKYNYSTWQNTIASYATVSDNYGNKYRRVEFAAAEPRGHVRTGAVSATNSVQDVLVFEKPLPSATHVDLDLPGEQLGVRGTFRFRIRRATWEEEARPGPPIRTPDPTGTEHQSPPAAVPDRTVRETPAPAPIVPPKPKPADPVPTHVLNPKPGAPVVLAKKPPGLDEYTEAFAKGDDKAVERMVKFEDVVLLREDLRVRQESVFKGVAYVRPTEGKYKGELLFVRPQHVKPLKP